MSCSRAFCSLPSVKKQKHDFYFNFRLMYNKTVIRFGFCGIENNQGLGKIYQAQPRLRLITPISTLVILDTTKTSSNNWSITASGSIPSRKPEPALLPGRSFFVK